MNTPKNSQIDFTAINAAALANAEMICRELLPDGKRRGREFVARNPNRVDRTAGSFLVNLVTGVWKDFATDDGGGDLVSLWAFVRNLEQGEAAREIADRLGVSGNTYVSRRRALTHKRDTTPAFPIETPHRAKFIGADSVPETEHPKHGKPSRRWTYTDAKGRPLGIVCRFNRRDGGKIVLPFSWINGRWQWKAMPAPRPLFNLQALTQEPGKAVIVTEGEKAANAAGHLLPDLISTTWPGGCKALGKSDFSPLKSRTVLLWPDADEPGKDAMNEVRRKLWEMGCRVATINTDGLPKGWDAADALAEGWTTNGVLELLDHERKPAAGSAEELEAKALAWWQKHGEPEPRTVREKQDAIYDYWEECERWQA